MRTVVWRSRRSRISFGREVIDWSTVAAVEDLFKGYPLQLTVFSRGVGPCYTRYRFIDRVPAANEHRGDRKRSPERTVTTAVRRAVSGSLFRSGVTRSRRFTERTRPRCRSVRSYLPQAPSTVSVQRVIASSPELIHTAALLPARSGLLPSAISTYWTPGARSDVDPGDRGGGPAPLVRVPLSFFTESRRSLIAEVPSG